MVVTLDTLQSVLGMEGYSLIELRDGVVTLDREGEMVYSAGAFYIGHQLVVETDHLLYYIAIWDAGLASRLDERFKSLVTPG